MSNDSITRDENDRPHGRPVLGGIAGFFLGLFVWLDLILFGVLPLESGIGYLLPVLGIAAGIGIAMWAPFGGRTADDRTIDSGQ